MIGAFFFHAKSGQRRVYFIFNKDNNSWSVFLSGGQLTQAFIRKSKTERVLFGQLVLGYFSIQD